ncbi:uncharacterized protein LOC143301503 isoform X2 [Babylonia areolata]|uniref:uncharacterized protein LOC143301503 isoform X2 n=1 Tax=Babylonia areolata TaxID=304850 RepID=UPI003FD48E45
MMPAASNKTEPKSSSEAGDTSKAFMGILDKKVRNIEKRKSRLDVIRSKQAAGDTLEREQQETLKHYDDVVACLEFARDLQKTYNTTMLDIEKQQKKQMKREKQERAASDLKRTSDILEIQVTLDAMGNDSVRDHFKTGKYGAVVLTDDNLSSLDELYKLISPPAAGEEKFGERMTAASEHINCLLEGRDRAVAGTTYKDVMDLLQLIIGCGYFERAREIEEAEVEAEPTEETEEAAEEEEEASSPPEAPPTSTETFSEPPQPEVPPPSAPVQPPTPEVIEEQPLPHTQVMPSGVAPHEGPTSSFVAQIPMSASPTLFQAPAMDPPPQPTVPKSRPLAEIVSQVEGTFSFLQESEIDMDSPHIDPAVVAVVEVKAVAPADIKQVVCVSAPHIDPAVVAAQPMMRPPSVPSQQPPQTNLMPAGFPPAPHVDQPGDSEVVQDPLSLSQQNMNQSTLDYSGASQSFAQAGLSHSQNLSSGVVADAMFQPPVEEAPVSVPVPAPSAQQQQPHSSHGMMGQALASGESVAQFELPPSIPLPPSQQAQQDGSQLAGQEKKFQLNASATEFQSRTMYSQMPLNIQNLPSQPPGPQNLATQPPSQPQSQPPHPPSSHPESRPMPPPGAVNTDFPSGANFAQAAGDFNQAGRGYRKKKKNVTAAGNYQGGGYQRGGRGGGGGPGYRGGPRGGRGNNGNTMQNGFNNRPQNGNARPSNRGGSSFQGFPPRNDYRPDGFQGYNANGFGGGAPYQKRGGAGGPGYPRGGNNRGAGGMRGGVPRGGPPRGAGGNRGGMNRPGNQ